MTSVQFLFDFGSPNAFLAHRAIPAIEQRTGVRFSYVPVLLGGLFKLTGNQSPATAFAGIKNKPAYNRLEMHRFIARHAITDFVFNPYFPVNTLQLMRCAVAAQELGVFERYVQAIYDAMWAKGLDMGQHEVVAATLAGASLPVEKLLAQAQAPEIKQRLVDNTLAAFDHGAFGSPSFLVGTELYFGKDSLRDVEDEIVRTIAPHA